MANDSVTISKTGLFYVGIVVALVIGLLIGHYYISGSQPYYTTTYYTTTVGASTSVPTTSIASTTINNAPGYVASFDGLNSVITIRDSRKLQLSTLTISGWVMPNGPPDNHWGWMVTKYDAYGVAGCGSSLLACYYNWGGQGEHDSQTPLSNDQWYFLTTVINATNGTQTLYVNGVLVYSGPSSILNQSYPMHIGALTECYNGDCDQNFAGYIGNIQIYNSTLSQQQISVLYQEGVAGTPINGQALAGWWPLDGNADDASGNGNNGQISNVSFVAP